jgi:hypothetical protein
MRAARALEAIHEFELSTVGEHGDRIDLAVAREGSAHGFDRRGVAEPQGREAVAKRGEVEGVGVGVGAVHAADCTIGGASVAIIMRDGRP